MPLKLAAMTGVVVAASFFYGSSVFSHDNFYLRIVGNL